MHLNAPGVTIKSAVMTLRIVLYDVNILVEDKKTSAHISCMWDFSSVYFGPSDTIHRKHSNYQNIDL